MRSRLLCLACLSFAVTGCGSKQPDQLPPGQGSGSGLDGGSKSDGGTTGQDGGTVAVGPDMAGANGPGAPVIVIDSPTAGGEVDGNTLTVTATVTSPTNTPIATDKVVLNVSVVGSLLTAPMTATGQTNQFSGTLPIDKVPAGMATFSVLASDVNGLVGSATGSYTHDPGPDIQINTPPKAGSTWTNVVDVDVTINDVLHPITDISQVSAKIRKDGDVVLTQVPGALPFRATAKIDVTQTDPVLSGPQLLTVTATSSNQITNTMTRAFVVDNQGPTITVNQPKAGQFVGGVTTISVNIVDDYSKVATNTVEAILGDDFTNPNNIIPLGTTDSQVFTGSFDARIFGKQNVFLNLTVVAADSVGNYSQIGWPVPLDNTPPWMAMDSHIQLRAAKHDSAQRVECSQKFSPLDTSESSPSEATGEGDTVKQIITLRARVEDHGNWAPGLLDERFSGVEPSSVVLYVIPDDGAGAVLATDTDGDGICDDVNESLLPTSSMVMSGQKLWLQMGPLPQKSAPGQFDFSAGTNDNTQCDYVGEAGWNMPTRMCVGTSMTGVIPWPDAANQTPIYSILSTVGTDCVGLQLDSLNKLPEGPTCAITQATDAVGNTTVSFPLHFCIDRGGGKCPPGWTAPSDCTGAWDKKTKQIIPGKKCVEAPAYVPGGVEPNPGTFPKSGEVRSLD